MYLTQMWDVSSFTIKMSIHRHGAEDASPVLIADGISLRHQQRRRHGSESNNIYISLVEN